MNDPRSTNAQLDRYVIAALGRFAELAPEPDPWPLQRRVDRPAGDGRQRWVASAAAAAVGVAGVGAIIAVTGNDAPDSVTRTDPTTPTTALTAAATNQPLCGTVVPAMMEFAVPFSGPVETTGDALVRRWEFQGGSLELVWPAPDAAPAGVANDAAVTRFEWTAGVGDEGVPFIGIDVGGDQAASPGDGYGGPPEGWGLPADFIYDVVLGLGYSDAEPELDAGGVPVYVDVPACDLMQLDVQDATGNVEQWLISLSGGPQDNDWSPTFIGATVDARATVVDAPSAFEDVASGCNTVSGAPIGEPDHHAEPIAALASFLDSDQGRHFGLSVTGWQELDVNNEVDRYWYVQPLESDPSVIAAVVTVERDGDGWTVSGYELTCG